MAKSQADILQHLRNVAARRGVEMTNLGNGHIQLRGPHLLVNYYPFSAKRTAYVAGTTAGVTQCDAEKAVAMARNVPKMVPKIEQDTRPGNSRKVRQRMLGGRDSCKCHWCPTIIDLDTSTIDHVIPLSRGGLDHSNNRVLACHPCNDRRGHAMPELKQWPASTDQTSPPWQKDP